jgi:hypothetical protein
MRYMDGGVRLLLLLLTIVVGESFGLSQIGIILKM